MSVAQENALKAQLKKMQEKRKNKEAEQARKRKAEKQRLHEKEVFKNQQKKARVKAENLRNMKKAQVEKKRRLSEKHAAHMRRQEDEAKRAAEKRIEKEKRQNASLIQQERDAKIADERLKREVVVEFDLKSIKPTLEQSMKRFGEVEKAIMTPFGFVVRYKTQASANKAKKKAKIVSQLPSSIVPQEIKRNAVHFEAPEEMGDIDPELLSQVKDAMGAYGAVANMKRRNRYVIIFFENRESANSLTGGGDEVTIEMGGHTIALLPGVPVSPRKKSQATKRAKAEARRLEQKAAKANKNKNKMEH